MRTSLGPGSRRSISRGLSSAPALLAANDFVFIAVLIIFNSPILSSPVQQTAHETHCLKHIERKRLRYLCAIDQAATTSNRTFYSFPAVADRSNYSQA